jgi:response regulator RpfG family c-di-GMP phosphodiesterase
MRQHPEIGYRIARNTDDVSHVAEEILSHHERWDGTGYPNGLMGTDIPLLARITALADAYEIMKNGRPYKKPMTNEEIRLEIQRCSGKQFDPEISAIFLAWQQLLT